MCLFQNELMWTSRYSNLKHNGTILMHWYESELSQVQTSSSCCRQQHLYQCLSLWRPFAVYSPSVGQVKGVCVCRTLWALMEVHVWTGIRGRSVFQQSDVQTQHSELIIVTSWSPKLTLHPKATASPWLMENIKNMLKGPVSRRSLWVHTRRNAARNSSGEAFQEMKMINTLIHAHIELETVQSIIKQLSCVQSCVPVSNTRSAALIITDCLYIH